MLNTEFEQFLDESGNLHFNEDATLVDYVERNVRDQADTLAYRFIDYSRERDGEAQDLTWAQFGKRLRAVAARLQQVTKPGDRVAILAPQSLEYVIGFLASLEAGIIAVPLSVKFGPEAALFRMGDSGAVAAVFDADCYARLAGELADLAGPEGEARIGSVAAGIAVGERRDAERQEQPANVSRVVFVR